MKEHLPPVAFRGARRAAAGLVIGLAAALPALAQAPVGPADAGPGLRWSASAFGTIGWARSNRPYAYQRFIDDDGGFERDTLLGGQLDVQFAPRWSATVQARLAPSMRNDDRWDVAPTWAFLAWRPTDEWLLRAGKLRVPLFLRSENLDVGQTYDEARLPAEVYTIAPTNDFSGAHASFTTPVASGELTTDVYWGRGRLSKRFWLREGVPGSQPPGASFAQVDTTVTGITTAWRAPDLILRLGLLQATTKPVNREPFAVRPAWAPLGPGINYWQTSNLLPGPGVDEVARIRNTFLQLGAEAMMGSGWRVAAEVVRVLQHDTELGFGATAGYVTVYRRVQDFTPYVTLAGIRTRNDSYDWSYQLDTTTVPGVVPGAALLNATMRTRADFLPVHREHSVALGASFALNASAKLKAEWLHSNLRQSQMVDVPAGDLLRQRRTIDVLSVSYSFVF